MLTSLGPVGAPATRLSVVPSTVMVLGAVKPGDSESLPEVPAASAVAPVIGLPAWLLTTPPVAELSVLKKLSPASTADAATSEVLASVEIDDVIALLKLFAVTSGVAPMAKLPAGSGLALLAVSLME